MSLRGVAVRPNSDSPPALDVSVATAIEMTQLAHQRIDSLREMIDLTNESLRSLDDALHRQRREIVRLRSSLREQGISP